jgi:hypothetical protein
LHAPDYLERGGIIHDMLAQYYVMKKYRSRWAQNQKSYADIVQSCIVTGRHKANKTGLSLNDIEEIVRVFLEYTDLWENDGWSDIVAVESVGSKVLYETEELVILYEVKIDLILRLNGMLIAVDHKHAQSRRDPNELSNQFKGYCWFLGSNNFIVNEIGFQKTIKPVEKFRRHLLNFPDGIIEEWKTNTVQWVQMQMALEAGNLAPRNFTSCDKFSGCEFKLICKSEPGELREFKKRAEFKGRTWDVGKAHL